MRMILFLSLILMGCSDHHLDEKRNEFESLPNSYIDVSKLTIGDLNVLIDQSIDFGVLTINQFSNDYKIILKNTGNNAVNLNFIFPVENGFSVKINRCGIILEKSASCQITLNFSSRGLVDGIQNSSLVINDTSIPLRAEVTGRPDPNLLGTAVIQLSLSSPFDPLLGSFLRTLTIKNVGTGVARKIKVNPSSEYSIWTNRCPAVLFPQKSCSIQIKLNKSRIVTTAPNGFVIIDSLTTEVKSIDLKTGQLNLLICPEGLVYEEYTGRCLEKGTVISLKDGFFCSAGIIQDENKNIYLADNDQQALFKLDSELNQTLVSNGWYGYFSKDNLDNIYVSLYGSLSDPNYSIEKITPEGVRSSLSIFTTEELQSPPDRIMYSMVQGKSIGDVYFLVIDSLGTSYLRKIDDNGNIVSLDNLLQIPMAGQNSFIGYGENGSIWITQNSDGWVGQSNVFNLGSEILGLNMQVDESFLNVAGINTFTFDSKGNMFFLKVYNDQGGTTYYDPGTRTEIWKKEKSTGMIYKVAGGLSALDHGGYQGWFVQESDPTQWNPGNTINALDASFNYMYQMIVDDQDNLLFIDGCNGVLRKIMSP